MREEVRRETKCRGYNLEEAGTKWISDLNRSASIAPEIVFTQTTRFILTTEILVAEAFTRGAFRAWSSSRVRVFTGDVTS